MSKITEQLGQQCEEIHRYLEKLRNQRQELAGQIKSIECDVGKLDKEIETLSRRRMELVTVLDDKQKASSVLDQTISEAETTYNKLIESSQTLLAFMKKEAFEVDRSLHSSS